MWAADGVKLFTIPNGTTVPAYGHYLAAGASYSLSNLGGTGAAAGDTPFLAGLTSNTGVALYDKDTSGGAPLDSVGFGSDIYVEGTGIASIGVSPFDGKNISFVRRHPYGGGTVVLDTNNNATDFSLVANDGGTYGSTLAILGGPSPENLASPPERTGAELGLVLFDPGVDGVTAPNYQFTAAVSTVSSKFIELRRKVTSTANFGNVRFKVTSVSTLNNNTGGTQADFRPTTSPGVTPVVDTAFGVTLDNGPIGYATLGVPDATDVMGGLNSTLKFGPVTPGTPLVAGTPLGVNFKLFYTTSGKPGYYWVTIEAKP